MSRTGCELRGHHDWTVLLDSDGWDAIAVACADWECDVRRAVEFSPEWQEQRQALWRLLERVAGEPTTEAQQALATAIVRYRDTGEGRIPDLISTGDRHA